MSVPTPNLTDYRAERAAFSWDRARTWLDGLPEGGGLNIAEVAVDRHVAAGCGERVALRCLDRAGGVTDVTYDELARRSNRFANALAHLGIEPGQTVYSLLGRVPPLYAAILGTFKARSVFAPLFSAFGPDPVKQRMLIGGARAVVTSSALYRKKIAPIRDEVASLQHVLLVDGDTDGIDGAVFLDDLLAGMPEDFQVAPTDPESTSLLHFTSGTTGKPKAAVHVHAAVVAHYATGRYALDLHPGDVYWCTADPGWVTGTSYGVISPLTHGVTMIVDEGEFDARRWYTTLAEQAVNVWYTAPTAIRMLMKAGADAHEGVDLSALRFVASVGEPLNPEAVVWGQEELGLTIHDNWWQTETGGIMIANFRACDVRPGSMGRPVPGITAGVLQQGADEDERVAHGDAGAPIECGDDEVGELALRTPWPSMFRDYLGQPQRYQSCFDHGWYLTGDLAKRDTSGYYWFVGRADDVIKTAGHLIGPFEVESVLMEHPAVAEVGVIGVPDPTMGQRIKAFVALKADAEPGRALQRELMALARTRLGPAVAPREIAFADDLPKTRSGKIMRRLLKARELGLPEGDTSTLEGRTT